MYGANKRMLPNERFAVYARVGRTGKLGALGMILLVLDGAALIGVVALLRWIYS